MAYSRNIFSGRRIFSCALFLCLLCAGGAARAETFDHWLARFRAQAQAAGISQATIAHTLAGLSPDPKVIELDHKQPEKKWTFVEYRKRIVDPIRIRKGREMMRAHGAMLNRISARYGVAPQYIVALWGIESNYGRGSGDYSIVRSLATLAWEGRRADFFRAELLNALRILDQGHIAPEKMKGSWAGAMGQNQFMPSSFLRFAADGDGDRRKDIWANAADVSASTANYLRSEGWQDGMRWGRAASLARGHRVTPAMIGVAHQKPLAEWERLGVRLPGGGHLPRDASVRASLVAPDGLEGPVYLAYNNYRVIMKWNRSTYFATSVGLLADAIAQGR
jgi:membrane-bound lytic murein transglycosylase B